MKDSQTQTEKDRAERAIYRAIDAVQALCDQGYGSSATERAFSQLREIETSIQNIRVRARKP